MLNAQNLFCMSCFQLDLDNLLGQAELCGEMLSHLLYMYISKILDFGYSCTLLTFVLYFYWDVTHIAC